MVYTIQTMIRSRFIRIAITVLVLTGNMIVSVWCDVNEPREIISRDSSRGDFVDAKCIAVDPHGNIYVVDGGSHEVVKLAGNDGKVARVGGYGWDDLGFDRPSDIVAPNGLDIYVADYGNHRIQRFDRNLSFVARYPSTEATTETRPVVYPRGVGVSRFGSVFVADADNNQISRLTFKGVEQTFGGRGSGAGRLKKPTRVRVSQDDRVYVQDENVLMVYDTFGNFIRTYSFPAPLRIISFALDGPGIYILDSCQVSRVMNDGTLFKIQRAVCDSSANTIEVPVDLAVVHNTLYVLTRSRVRIVALPVEQIRSPFENQNK